MTVQNIAGSGKKSQIPYLAFINKHKHKYSKKLLSVLIEPLNNQQVVMFKLYLKHKSVA